MLSYVLTTINNSTEQMRRLYTNPPFMLSSLTGYRQYHSCTTDINYIRILTRKVSQRFVLTEAWRSKHQLFSHSPKVVSDSEFRQVLKSPAALTGLIGI